MKVKFISNNKNDPNNKIYLTCVLFCINELFDEKVANSLKSLDVKMNAVMNDSGQCFLTYLKQGFKIRIKILDNMNFIETIKTIAHETVHAYQFASKNLIINEYEEWIWKRKNYGYEPYKKLTIDQIYKKLPWEKEAITKERVLVEKFLSEYIDNNS